MLYIKDSELAMLTILYIHLIYVVDAVCSAIAPCPLKYFDLCVILYRMWPT